MTSVTGSARTRALAAFAALALLVGLAASAGVALAQDATAPPIVPGSSATAEAFGREAYGSLFGQPAVAQPPTPLVRVAAGDGLMPNARDSQLDVGPVGDDPSGGTVEVQEVSAAADAAAETATATASVSDVDLLVQAGVPLVTADAIVATSTTTCTPQTAEEAAAGSQVVGLSIGGQAVPADAPINTEIEIPGVARVTVKQVLPDTAGTGWTVRGLHVRSLDPLTGAVDGEVIVAEAHSAVACADAPPLPPEPEPALRVTKSLDGLEPGDDGLVRVQPGSEISYLIDVTNTTEDPCDLTRVIDVLPAPLTLVTGAAGLEGAPTAERGPGGTTFFPADITLEPGATFTGAVVAAVPDPLVAGAYFNDAQAFGTCGSGRSGLTAGIAPDVVPPDVDPCSAAVIAPGFTSATRLAGEDRNATALRVSGLVSIEEADAVVLARSDQFPDALAASGLAAELCAPLLLNPPTALLPAVQAEIDRLDPETVYLVGGTRALSDEVAAGLRAAGYDVVRVAGDSRYATAREVALEIVELGGQVDRATVVRADIFPDAMSAANLATHARSPILLTDSDELSGVTAATLPTILSPSAQTVYVGGGPRAIDPSVEAELARTLPTTRLSGPDRFATSVAFAVESLRFGADVPATWFASGADFPDALAGTVGAFRMGAPLLLTDPSDLSRSTPTRSFVADNAAAIHTAVIVGGTQAVSTQVEQQILDLIRGS